ncbi:hypothetical protein CCHL11_01470 [Colletotrichum chlorophyti]|uniref:C2H2-type domain-containing protein n=1 Tax=Colletotrichum chlorophyti TaxID=708187 RepID=A0A1Q8RYN7_9PEZI|nr:hypothetical protein CCHL11_01470 [Colletotrichum chlorophyti]
MPPTIPIISPLKSKPASSGFGNTTSQRQGTLDKFLTRQGNGVPSPSSSMATPKKTSPAQPKSRSSFAIVLKPSPSTSKQGQPTSVRTVDDDADDLIMSDLSPRIRNLAAQAATGVSIAKPALPIAAIEGPDASSSGVTTPTQGKKRGRPKGYRPGVMGRKTLQGEILSTGPRKLRPDRPKAGSMYTGKRRGRPPRAVSPPPRAIYESLNPHFNTFICEWKGCKAELHNLATLRKHVIVVHAKNTPFKCRWARCAEQQRPCMFSTLTDLKSHLEDLHMLAIAWQVGDGPQVSLKRYIPDDGSQLPNYLFDKAGNQITPSIRDQKEEDILTWRLNRRRLKDLLLLRDENLPSEEEDNAVDDMAE